MLHQINHQQAAIWKGKTGAPKANFSINKLDQIKQGKRGVMNHNSQELLNMVYLLVIICLESKTRVLLSVNHHNSGISSFHIIRENIMYFLVPTSVSYFTKQGLKR